MDQFLSALPKLPLPSEMNLWDKKAIAFGIPETMLMENAGRELYNASRDFFGPCKTIAFFMGTGNNGGDAACMARHARDAGSSATIFRISPKISETSAFHLELARQDEVKIVQLPELSSLEQLHSCLLANCPAMPDLLVDGLLGTGFRGNLRPPLDSLVQFLNLLSENTRIPIISIDIPSGLNATTGNAFPIAVRASLTVSLEAAQPGLLLEGSTQFTGKLLARPIQFPQKVLRDCPSRWHLLDGEALKYSFPPQSNSFKNSYGHIYVVGGAPGYEGAAHLACTGALRAGAGLATAVAPADSLSSIRANRPEIMTLPLGNIREIAEQIQALLSHAGAIVVGPGMGRSEDAALFLKALLALENRPPTVVDADALVLLSSLPNSEALLRSEDIITPHPGEAATLLHTASREIQKDRPAALEELCNIFQCVTVLKGSFTLIGQGAQLRIICPYDIPQLAIGGAGDVLAGCIAGTLTSHASTLSSIGATALAVATHAMAGLSLAQKYPQRGILASQLADALPHATQFVSSQRMPFNRLLPWPQ